jgi:hypothetical protein
MFPAVTSSSAGRKEPVSFYLIIISWFQFMPLPIKVCGRHIRDPLKGKISRIITRSWIFSMVFKTCNQIVALNERKGSVEQSEHE